MGQLFVTPVGRLMERWKTAFPAAQLVSSVAEIREASSAPRGILWLDIGVLAPLSRLGNIREAVDLDRPVVAMTSTPAESEAFQVLQAGAAGYCHVNAAPQQLREIGLVVEHGGIWMPPELIQRLIKLSLRVVPTEKPAEQELDDLTARELMVAEQIATGATNREISQRLAITERTVKAHLSAIFQKLRVRDRVQLALAMNNIQTSTSVI